MSKKPTGNIPSIKVTTSLNNTVFQKNTLKFAFDKEIIEKTDCRPVCKNNNKVRF